MTSTLPPPLLLPAVWWGVVSMLLLSCRVQLLPSLGITVVMMILGIMIATVMVMMILGIMMITMIARITMVAKCLASALMMRQPMQIGRQAEAVQPMQIGRQAKARGGLS